MPSLPEIVLASLVMAVGSALQASVGLGMALYLVWAELFRIHAICSWCTVVHVVTFALWIIVLFGQILSTRGDAVAAEPSDSGDEAQSPVSRPKR